MANFDGSALLAPVAGEKIGDEAAMAFFRAGFGTEKRDLGGPRKRVETCRDTALFIRCEKIRFIDGPIFREAIGLEKLRRWGEQRLVEVFNSGDFSQKEGEVRMLGEAGEAGRCDFWRTSMTCWTPASESRVKNSSAVFPVKPMVQRRRSMRSRNTRWLREMRGMQSLSTEEQGVRESGITAGGEKRSAGDVFEAVEDEEAILGVALGFEDGTAPNVGGCDTAVQERGADHQEAMHCRGSSSAHMRAVTLVRESARARFEAFGEIGGAAARGVINVPVFPVDARIGGPAAQTFTEKFVANSGRRKIALERTRD